MEKRIKRRMEKIQHRSVENMEPDPRTHKNIQKTPKKTITTSMEKTIGKITISNNKKHKK